MILLLPGSALSAYAQNLPAGIPMLTPVSQSATQSVLQGSESAIENAWSESYRLGTGDVVQITVFGAEEYSGEVIVLQDGAVNLPRAGRVRLKGQTFQEAAQSIAQTYAVYIRNPLVTVTPVKLRPVRVAIAGEVNRPGAYSVQATENLQEQTFPTLTQIIAQAGGITARANLKQVEVRRQVSPMQSQVTTINLWELLQSSNLSQDVFLQSGDEIYVPTAEALTPEQITELASANFAPALVKVYVAGEVTRPGLLEVPLNTPLNQAILAAGGFNDRANRRSVNLVRLNPDGTVAQRRISIDFNQGIGDENPILMAQDVVVVERSNLSSFGQITGTILNPFSQILNAVLGLSGLLR